MELFVKNTNKIINDVMANNNSAVMLFAPSGTGKTDFLTELGNRYHMVYWFNALTDNIETFGESLAEKVYQNSPMLLAHAKQLQYCDPTKNGEAMVIMSILQHISTIKSNCLFVFERMEMLPENFDNRLIERLIKHCPKNLKIVVSSDRFLNFDYTKFEPVYPVLIDEKILDFQDARPNFRSYIKELNEEQIAFLAYISELDYTDGDFLNTFYSGGNELVSYLSGKECYVAARGKNLYRLTTSFRNWLKENRAEVDAEYAKFNDIPATLRFAKYLLQKEKYYEAFKLCNKYGDIPFMDECISKMVQDKDYQMKLQRYCTYDAKPQEKFDYAKYPYYALYQAIRFLSSDANTSIEIVLEIKDLLGENLAALSMAYEILIKGYLKQHKAQEANALALEAIESLSHDLSLFEPIFCLIPTICQDLSIEPDFKLIKKAESILEEHDCTAEIWYAKVIETIAYFYHDIGRQKKAIALVSELKNNLPYYIIPYKMVMLSYYSGDIEEAKRLADEAYKLAQKNEMTTDISLIYTTMANIDMYYGKTESAIKWYDKAVNTDYDVNQKKFYNIMQRCIAYAKIGKQNYAREVAHIYLKYSETYAKNYTNRMMCALAYCYSRQGNKQQANFYATSAVKQSQSRTMYWAISMGIAIEYLLERGDLKDASNLIRNLLKTCEKYNLTVTIIDTIDVFEPILKYAEQNAIMNEYVAEIRSLLTKKEREKQVSHNLKVKLFGTTAVYSGDEEIQWKTKKAKELFLHYILAGKEGIDRNLIIDYLWKDYVYESAINNLKTTNNIIRKTLAAFNVEFDLQYINCKYILNLGEVIVDYDEFKSVLESYKNEDNIYSKMTLMSTLVDKFKEGFAVEQSCVDFLRHRQNVLQEMSSLLLKLIMDLKSKAMYVEAKKFLNMLLQVEKKEDYKRLMDEIVANII